MQLFRFMKSVTTSSQFLSLCALLPISFGQAQGIFYFNRLSAQDVSFVFSSRRALNDGKRK
jgi:hypothetical protein